MERAVRRRLAAWLRDHDEVVSEAEAAGLGCSTSSLRHLARGGELRRAGPKVYVDPVRATSPRTAMRVAVHLGGEGAAVSHRSAAGLWGLLDRTPRRPSVTVPRGRSTWCMRHRDIQVHRSRRRPPTLRCGGLPVTDPVRTLLDLAPTATDRELDHMVDRAYELGLVSTGSLLRGLAGGYRCPGAPALRRCLARRGDLDRPGQSALEAMANRVVDELVDEGLIPAAHREYTPPGSRVRFDYAWPEVALCVEVDGYRWHGTPGQMVADYDRRNDQTARGWTFLTFTWLHLAKDREGVGRSIVETYQRLLALRQQQLRR